MCKEALIRSPIISLLSPKYQILQRLFAGVSAVFLSGTLELCVCGGGGQRWPILPSFCYVKPLCDLFLAVVEFRTLKSRPGGSCLWGGKQACICDGARLSKWSTLPNSGLLAVATQFRTRRILRASN